LGSVGNANNKYFDTGTVALIVFSNSGLAKHLLKTTQKKTAMKIKLLDRLITAITFSLTLFFFLPLTIFFTNRQEIIASDGLVFRIALIYSGLAFVFSMILLLLFKGKLRIIANAVLVWLTVVVWLQANVFNWNYGLWDGDDLAWELVHWKTAIDLSAWILLAVFLGLWAVWKNKRLHVCLIILLLMQSANIALLYQKSAAVTETEISDSEEVNALGPHQFSYSKDKNIIVLILDSYQSDVFLESLEDDPDMMQQLQGFTFYPDALSSYISTRLAVPELLTGTRYQNEIPLNRHLKEVHEKHSLIQLLSDLGYDTSLFTTYPSTYVHELAFLNKNQKELSAFFPAALNQLYVSSFFRMAPHILRKEIFTRFIQETTSTEDRDQFVSALNQYTSVSLDSPALRWYHLLGLHFPWNADGKKLSSGNRDNSLLIAEQLNLVIKNLVHQLQSESIYDSSAILIFGDHGNGGVATNNNRLARRSSIVAQTACFQNKTAINVAKTVHNYSWERTLPMVLFKPFQAEEAFQVSCTPISLADIYPTILDLAGLEPHNETKGTSLLKLDAGEPRVRTALFYDYKDRSKRPKGYFSPLYEYAVDGFCWHEKSYAYSGFVYQQGNKERKALDQYPWSKPVYFGYAGKGAQYLGEGWEAQEKSHVMAGSEATLHLLSDAPAQNAILRLKIEFISPHIRKNKLMIEVSSSGKVLMTSRLSEKTYHFKVPASSFAETGLPIKIALKEKDSSASPDLKEPAIKLLALRLSPDE
jgi:hypothetical protein